MWSLALVALTDRPAQSYERYVEQVDGDAIAREVKLADLADNLANNKRLPTAPDVVASYRALRTSDSSPPGGE